MTSERISQMKQISMDISGKKVLDDKLITLNTYEKILLEKKDFEMAYYLSLDWFNLSDNEKYLKMDYVFSKESAEYAQILNNLAKFDVQFETEDAK